jgi:drug/metabolite transporter (DMT)-like permease
VKYILVLVAAIAMTIAHVLLKKGMLLVAQPHGISELPSFFLKVFANPYIISAIVPLAVTVLAWILALQKAPLSFLYPFMALSFVFVALCSSFIFKESLSVLRWLGIAVICVGVFLVSKS